VGAGWAAGAWAVGVVAGWAGWVAGAWAVAGWEGEAWAVGGWAAAGWVAWGSGAVVTACSAQPVAGRDWGCWTAPAGALGSEGAAGQAVTGGGKGAGGGWEVAAG
jgi:hypothetical protein